MSQILNENNIEQDEREITSDEYFTPPEIIQKHIQGLDPNKSFIDNNAGIGNWLVEILEWKIANGIPKEIALTQLYGVELNLDTCKIMAERLWGPVQVLTGDNIPKNMRGNGVEALFSKDGIIIEQIVCADCLKYNYTFGSPETFNDHRDSFLFFE